MCLTFKVFKVLNFPYFLRSTVTPIVGRRGATQNPPRIMKFLCFAQDDFIFVCFEQDKHVLEETITYVKKALTRFLLFFFFFFFIIIIFFFFSKLPVIALGFPSYTATSLSLLIWIWICHSLDLDLSISLSLDRSPPRSLSLSICL